MEGPRGKVNKRRFGSGMRVRVRVLVRGEMGLDWYERLVLRTRVRGYRCTRVQVSAFKWAWSAESRWNESVVLDPQLNK